jgi:hypothetical protein
VTWRNDLDGILTEIALMDFDTILAGAIPQKMKDAALATVKQSDQQFSNNSTRRNWAIEQLMQTLHLKEGMARILVELALFLLKRESSDEGERNRTMTR